MNTRGAPRKGVFPGGGRVMEGAIGKARITWTLHKRSFGRGTRIGLVGWGRDIRHKLHLGIRYPLLPCRVIFMEVPIIEAEVLCGGGHIA